MIHFENVVKAYARTARPALDHVTLDIPQGQFVYLVGASGSGKSTVIRLLLCEEAATSGRIEVAGRDLSRLRGRGIPRLRRDLGVVFQDFRLLPDKTVHDNVAYVMHVLGAPSKDVRAAVPETLELVGLTALSRRFPHELSGGEQQRVAIARAIVKKPRLLLADEPTGNLDPGTSLEIVKLLNRINKAGTTVLMATHDDSIVNQLRRRVVELDAGRVVRDEADGAYLQPRPAAEQQATAARRLMPRPGPGGPPKQAPESKTKAQPRTNTPPKTTAQPKTTSESPATSRSKPKTRTPAKTMSRQQVEPEQQQATPHGSAGSRPPEESGPPAEPGQPAGSAASTSSKGGKR